MKYSVTVIALSSLLSITLLSGCKTISFSPKKNELVQSTDKNLKPVAQAAPDAQVAPVVLLPQKVKSTPLKITPKDSKKHSAITRISQPSLVAQDAPDAPQEVNNQLCLGNETLIKAPTDPLPAYLDASRSVKLTISEPQVLQVILGRLGAKVSIIPRPVKTGKKLPNQNLAHQDLTRTNIKGQNLTFQIEERTSRSAGENLRLPKSSPLKIDWNGPLSGLLDVVASKSGYRWQYSAANSRVVFYRYHDKEYASHLPKLHASWVVDPKRHTSLRQVLQSWAKQSGWNLSWSPSVPDYTIGAKASFSGRFEEAVTALAETNRTIAPIVPWFYYKNKQLVIRDAK